MKKINITSIKTKTYFFIIFLTFTFLKTFSQDTNIPIEGVLIDKTKITIPYAAIILQKKAKGTSSTEDGDFLLMISNNDLTDTLVVNSLGFKPFKIMAQDFLNKTEKTIILEESTISLDEVRLVKPNFYVINALKNLKTTTVSNPHQLTLLYRRASSEEEKARFFIEQYMKIQDRGPSALRMDRIQILESRKSADYRFFKKKEFRHSVIPMTIRNPIRQDMRVKKIKWKKIGDSSYENEDVVIIEGKPIGQPSFKLYIGVDTYAIYKVENKANNSLYVYKKNKEGKLYLSYHSRQWTSQEKITKNLQNRLGKGTDKIQATYKHEVFVLDIETNKKKMKVRHNSETETKDMSLLEIPYNAKFWNTFQLPPETKYFKRIKDELESNFGVSLEAQFQYSNK
ncbi:carboxypeptidase-like regulatory domain-containing protein [Lutibacter citreus]|uniref:carboxypeptidase-like regulatory domain-containing protein n=1 Tax=Lutibacter citreus TaxID=2138210 RepID=UPI000DBE9244|nr:carboxypeptidase-like regulatory domain-containing protein [Lutibacter citreus]